jgi:hypothetical protein
MVNRIKKIGRYVGAIKEGAKQLLGKEVSRAVSSRAAQAVAAEPPMPSFKKGGLVKKTGPARLHKGERVLTVAQVASLKKMLK